MEDQEYDLMRPVLLGDLQPGLVVWCTMLNCKMEMTVVTPSGVVQLKKLVEGGKPLTLRREAFGPHSTMFYHLKPGVLTDELTQLRQIAHASIRQGREMLELLNTLMEKRQ